MTKLTYAQQLAHPNWQKKRLEILSNNGFQCQMCFDQDNTLHVHHKTYRKGAMAWEYENENFLCLCKDCHELAHKEKDLLNFVISEINPSSYMEAAALLHAFFNNDRHDDLYSFSPFTYEAGGIAKAISEVKLNIKDVQMLKDKLLAIDSKVEAIIEFKDISDIGDDNGTF